MKSLSGRHQVVRLVLLKIMFYAWSIAAYGQCGDTTFFLNPSFELQSCCPMNGGEIDCLDDWDIPSFPTTDYYHTCGFMGAPGWTEPPTPFPDGDGCIGFYANAIGAYNEMIQTCVQDSLKTDRTYQLSAYAGFNMLAPYPSRNPIVITLWGSVGDCSVLPSFGGPDCPPPAEWDILTSISYFFSGELGWVYGISDCFQPTQEYNRFIIGASCFSEEDWLYNFLDDVQLHTCYQLVPRFDPFPVLCQGDPPPPLPTQSNNQIPIPGTWNPSVISTSTPGTFDYTFTPSTNNNCEVPVTISIEVLRVATQQGNFTYNGCSGDGFEIDINGTTYNESNPTGSETMDFSFVCDSTTLVQLNFTSPPRDTFYHEDCDNSGYSLLVNSTEYSINNPSGTELLTTAAGCDSFVFVDLNFIETTNDDLVYSGCEGDGYEVFVNNTRYDINNPIGTEYMINQFGCDSVVNVALVFSGPIIHDEFYIGCEGDGYFIYVNGTLYDEFNNTGIETLTTADGCDSIVSIDLVFQSEPTRLIEYDGCYGDGYSVVVNGVTYDESNPVGTELIIVPSGCDTLVDIQLSFSDEISRQEEYAGCLGDGYAVVVNGVVYDESNPTGEERMVSASGCDSVVMIDLVFNDEMNTSENYSGCIGDGYSVTVNNVVYDETNPTGIETLVSSGGCDSIVTIDLVFNDEINTSENYIGCIGDGYSVTVNNVVYDESNPTGTETLLSSGGCDSVVMIFLEYNDEITTSENYIGCLGDGYSVTVNNVVYDESNPAGTETLVSSGGCDSVVTIDLVFNDEINMSENYSGCIGDGYSVTVNNVVYDETNPTGMETMVSSGGCDSIVTIDLVFNEEINTSENYSGCFGDGYSVTVNNVVYDESNPTGSETLVSSGGCDSVVTIDLVFNEEINTSENYSGCFGDGYSVTVNNVVYDESNPTGTETLLSSGGCDSIVTIALEFNDEITTSENYNGCEGDGYSVTVNNVVYDETNRIGEERMMSTTGCDSVVTIDLDFVPAITASEQYVGCSGDGYSVEVNGVIYNENNPIGEERLVGSTGCDSVVTIELFFEEVTEFAASFSGEANSDIVLDINSEIPSIDSIASITWSPSDNLSCSDCLQPIFNGIAGTEYAVEITDVGGCISRGLIQVSVSEEPIGSVFIPDVFSPNDDGINDKFLPYTSPDNPVFVSLFEIYDRWGGRVFQRQNLLMTSPDLGWDGTIKDKTASPGVYVYVLRYRVIDQEQTQYGQVNLVK